MTDVRLPEVDCWTIAHWARRLRPDLPVVYVSGDSVAEWDAKGVAGSVMLQKPFVNEHLIEAVTKLVTHGGKRT